MSLTRRTLDLTGLSGLGSCATRPVANGQTIFNAVDDHPADHPTVTAVKWIGDEPGLLNVWPFWLSCLAVLMLVTFIPAFSLWLPSLMK